MSRFKGYGAGSGTWTKRRYLPDGTVLEGDAPAPKRTTAYHVRFKPMVSRQVHHRTAKALGLKRTKDRGTVFETEAQLDRYLAYEKDHGRDVGWKDW